MEISQIATFQSIFYSNPGDVILDPFGGVHSTPYQAIKMGRKGCGIELNPDYWKFGVTFCERAERELTTPTLFDFAELDTPTQDDLVDSI